MATRSAPTATQLTSKFSTRSVQFAQMLQSWITQMYSDWQAAAKLQIAKLQIAKLHEQFDSSMTWQERQKVLRAGASQFHGGTSWGQKVWAKHCRRYLEMHGKPPLSPPPQEPTFATDIIFPFRAAQAIDARRAETQSGSVVDESAVAKPCAQGGDA